MHSGIKRQIIERALLTPDIEICGLIYTDSDGPKAFFSENVSNEDHSESFEISQNDHAHCLQMGRLLGTFHSHPDGPAAFSPADIEMTDELCLPAYLYDVGSREWLEYIPSSFSEPLEGRPFTWGFDDCFGLIRSYFRQTLGIHIGDYDRDETFGLTPSSEIMDNFAREGFREITGGVSSLQLHDVLLFDEHRKMPQHFGVFKGDSRFLHHRRKMLSRIDQIDGERLKCLKHILRHNSL